MKTRAGDMPALLFMLSICTEISTCFCTRIQNIAKSTVISLKFFTSTGKSTIIPSDPYMKGGVEMNDKAIEILNKLNEAAAKSEYGGYISKRDFWDIVRVAMFGEYEYSLQRGLVTRRSYGHCRTVYGLVERPVPLTAEQHAKVNKTCERMLSKGIVRKSKSGNMVKPMVTAEEWFGA